MLIPLPNTTDLISIITDVVCDVDVIVVYADHTLSSDNIETNRQLTNITTATTTTVLTSPTSGVTRQMKLLNARNVSASITVSVTVQYNANGTLYELHAAALRPGEALEYVEGVGFFVLAARSPVSPNISTSDQAIGASATAYLTGSAVIFPSLPSIGATIRWTISVSKSGAATATETWSVRFGTTGTTSDTARNSFVGDTETAIADDAEVSIVCTIRGPISASCVTQAMWVMDDNLTTTGFSNTARKAQVRVATSAAFDITALPQYVGIVLATGASHSITIRQVIAEVIKA